MGLGIEFEKVGGFDPVAFDEWLCDGGAQRGGLFPHEPDQDAGSTAAPAAVMCPCVDGLHTRGTYHYNGDMGRMS
jgi:N-carbamoyl-L-amino-acid hydrolase